MNEIDKINSTLVGHESYDQLLLGIRTLIEAGVQEVERSVNTAQILVYWGVGRYIVEFEQHGEQRAQYGKSLLSSLSRDLTQRYGTGFNRNNLQYMRHLYQRFPNCTTLSCKLTWSHYVEILKCDNDLEFAFYLKQCESERWTVRQLKRQINSMLYHRIAATKDNTADILRLSEEGDVVEQPRDLLRDPYVMEYLGIQPNQKYKENEIETGMYANLKTTLLELGKGFAFIKEQYHIPLAGRHFYCDLVFYNCILKCYVLIDLKRDEIQHEDIGQMNLYLNYFKHEVCQPDDNPPVGIVLGAKKDEVVMEYALEGITNQLFTARYQLYLPNREELQSRLDNRLIEQSKQLEDNKDSKALPTD